MELPSSIINLKSLEVLDLSRNNLKTIPKSIWRLKNLKKLNLFFNQIEHIPESISKLPKIKELRLDYNKLNQLPNSIKDLKSVECLDIDGNPLSKFPEWIFNHQSLIQIALPYQFLYDLDENIEKKILDCCKFIIGPIYLIAFGWDYLSEPFWGGDSEAIKKFGAGPHDG